MNPKSGFDNRWWVETSIKRPKPTAAQAGSAALPIGAKFYLAASDYSQDEAKDHLTDNNLRLARQADPPLGQWVYVAMTQERCPERMLGRLKREFTVPAQARGIIIGHGPLVRLLICGPELEDWMIDVRLAPEASVDAYVWGTLYRERLFRHSRDALRQARQWALSLIQYPPPRHDVIRGDLL